MSKLNWKSKPALSDGARRSVRHLRQFARETDGSMTILALFLLMIVFTAAGFAVDVMRYDRERVKLQYALDRAVLAAADLDQQLCPVDVVRDYLSKENLDQYLVDGSVKVTPETCDAREARLAGKRKVEAQAEMQVRTHFMQWSGVDTLGAVAASVAEESIGDVEISLVLDVSGSMRGTKLADLKDAANKFVDEMVEKTEDGKMSMSIVPYSEQVALPDYFINALNTRGGNPLNYICIDFEADDFTTTTFDAFNVYNLDTGGIIGDEGSYLNRTLHFSIYGSNDPRFRNFYVTSYTCGETQTPSQRTMTIMQKDAATIKADINRLQAAGWTSIDVGLKWGLTLLDDSIQPLIEQLADDTNIPGIFDDRPGRNRTADSLKVVVLMTDGENTLQHKVNEPYNHGFSDIYWNDDQNVYSVLIGTDDAGNDEFLWPDVPVWVWHLGNRWGRERIQDHAFGDGTILWRRCSTFNGQECTSFTGGPELGTERGESVRLSWPDVWASTEKLAIYNLLKKTLGDDYANDFNADSTTIINQSTKDPRVTSLCTQAAEQQVVIFSIAYEAPNAVKPMLRDCAVEDSRFYEAGSDSRSIEEVFDSISASIQNLRLTQ